MNRVTGVVLAMAGVLCGYAAAGHRLSAAGDDVSVRRLPDMNRGDHVTLTFASGSLASGLVEVDCRITNELHLWVQCANPTEGNSSSDRERPWYDTTRVVMVKRVQK